MMNYHTYFKLPEGTLGLEGHHTQFMRRLGSLTYSNNNIEMYYVPIASGRERDMKLLSITRSIGVRYMDVWQAKNHSMESELSMFIYSYAVAI